MNLNDLPANPRHDDTTSPDPREGPFVCPDERPARPWQRITTLPALPVDQELLASLLVDARMLLWTARVRRSGSAYAWELDVPAASLRSPLIDYTAYKQHGYLWHPSFAPDFARTEARYRAALARGATGYEQQFRITHGGRTVWLEEVVRISTMAPDEWHFSGLLRDITAQKEAQEAEQQARAEVERLVQHAQCMLWYANVTSDAPGELQWDIRVLRSGLRDEIFDDSQGPRSRDIYDAFDVPQKREMAERASAAIRGGAPGYEQEFALTRHHDQRTFWLREHVAIRPLRPGAWALSGVMIDVTAQKVAEKVRHETQIQLQQLLDQVDCIVWQAELLPQPDGTLRWRISAPPSRLYRRLFKREPDAPILLKFWTPEATPEFYEMERTSQAAIARGAPGYEQEFRHVVDGQTVWLHESVTVLRRTTGTVYLAGAVIDITARKLAELQLSAEKERLAVTLRAMDESVITIDTSGAITFLNRAAETLLDVVASDVLGQPLATIGMLRLAHSATPVAWSPEKQSSVEFPPDTELVRRSGATVRVDGCVAPLHDGQNARTGAVIVLRDVTERHLLQAQLQRASTLESVGILAGGIAHDFNNILTALLANLSLAEMDAPQGTAFESYLREAHAATDRAAALAKQLLTFAKGGDPLLAAVELPDIIHEVARFTLRGTKVDYAPELAPDLWPAKADRGQFAQIIQNLVLNAAQAMPEGGVVRIAARNEEVKPGTSATRAAGCYVRLTIADSGRGIPPQDVDKIFTPYFTTKAGGHGLGLAVVYSIVHKHRGAIDVHSAPGEGTTFELWLPAAKSAALSSVSVDRSRKTPQLCGRVLLMDDEPAILRVLANYLRQTGLEIEATLDGAAAVEAYRSALGSGPPFDVVVMDLTVPGKMGGREAIAELRALDPTVRAIVASGYSSDPVLAHYREYGFSAIAAKPYDIAELAQAIARLIPDRPR